MRQLNRREILGLMGTLPLPGVVGLEMEMDSGRLSIFHTVEIAAFAEAHETHVVTVGCVAYVARETDGDRHIKLIPSWPPTPDESDPFIVCEIIPELPVPLRPLRLGDTLKVWGIRRFDDETAPGHQHWELHPVVAAKILPRPAL